MNPNHFLAVAVDYLFRHRPAWPERAAVGKTLVSSSMIDLVAEDLGRRLVEVPVGFNGKLPAGFRVRRRKKPASRPRTRPPRSPAARSP